MPHSSDPKYAERAIPQYERAVELAGGMPVRIPLDKTPADVKNMIAGCDGVLLPGSNADVDPARFYAERSRRTAAADPRRDDADNLLLDDAYALRKPVLCICYGLQSLNVYRAGSLVQHIPDYLPKETRGKINHAIGGKVAVAHTVEINGESRLGQIVSGGAKSEAGRTLVVPVNSSHHQSADAIGQGLRVVARCPDDGIVEALEGTAPDHFVVAVQWHPERSAEQDQPSLDILRAFVSATGEYEGGR
jgi:putative glutamine amidotransferase